jgi:hypothetical protein
LNITAQMIVGTYGFNTGGSDGEDPRVYDLRFGYNRVVDPEGGVFLENSVLTDDRAPVQLVSDKVVITAWGSTALEFADHDPSEVLDEYANILRVENEMGAIGNTISWSPVHSRPRKISRTSSQPGAGIQRPALKTPFEHYGCPRPARTLPPLMWVRKLKFLPPNGNPGRSR